MGFSNEVIPGWLVPRLTLREEDCICPSHRDHKDCHLRTECRGNDKYHVCHLACECAPDFETPEATGRHALVEDTATLPGPVCEHLNVDVSPTTTGECE